MRFTLASAAIAALISTALAQTRGFDSIISPTSNQELPAGSSFDIVWQPGSQTGTITITLLQGDTPGTLQVGRTLASGVDNQAGKFTWSVPSSSSYATYGFQITLDGATGDDAKMQYSYPFHIVGASSSSSSQSSSPSSSASSTSMNSSTTITSSAAPTNTSSNATMTSSCTNQTVTSSTASLTSTKTIVSSSSGGTASTSLQTVTSSSVAMSTVTKATTSGTSTTSTGVPQVSGNSAVSNVARGSLALLGGLLAAVFAL